MAIAAANGMITGSFVADIGSWKSAPYMADNGIHGSSACAMCDMVYITPGAMLTSVWKETVGKSIGRGYLAKNSRLLSYVKSSSDLMSPWKIRSKRDMNVMCCLTLHNNVFNQAQLNKFVFFNAFAHGIEFTDR